MIRTALVAALVGIALPQLARARPAVIRVFEASARSAPRGDAPVVHQFAENAEVSVADEAQDGWRRVRLPDGAVAWIEDSALTLGVAAPPVAVLKVEPTRPDLRARMTIADLDQLVLRTAADSEVNARARSLATRRTAAFVVGGLGTALGFGLLIAGGHAATTSINSDVHDPNFGKQTGSDGTGLIAAGVVTLAATFVAAVLTYPKRGETLEVVNAWNAGHPQDPLELEIVHVYHGDTVLVQ